MSRAARMVALLAALLPALAAAAPPPEGLRAEGEGRWADALAIYERELQRFPSDFQLWKRVADIHAAQQRPAAAAAALEKVAELQPQNVDLLLGVSQAWAMANEPAKALAAARRAEDAMPQEPRYRQAVADLAVWNGDLALAESRYRWRVERDPNDAGLLKSLAQVLARRGALDEAVRYYAAYVRARPDDGAALLEYATHQMYRGDFKSADQLLKDYESRFGRTEALAVAEAELLARSGQPRRAIERLPSLLAARPDSYELHLIHALALNSGRRAGEAQDALGELQRLGAGRPETQGAELQVVTPRRTQLSGMTEWYDDTGGLTTFRSGARLGASPFAQSRVTGAFDHWQIRSAAGNGFDTPAGTSEDVDALRLTLEQQVTPWLGFKVGGGQFETDRGSAPHRLAVVELYPADALTLRLSGETELLRVSPRSVYRGIERETTELTAQWRQGWSGTFDLRTALEDYNDGNAARETMVTQRFAVVRSARYNLDLGLRAQWLHYDLQLANGYYAPDDFQRYWGVGYGYWKVSDDSGVGLSFGLGPERDAALDSGYEWGGDLRVEGVFGVFRDWQLRSYAGYGGRFDGTQVAGAWRGSGVGLELTRRF